MAANHSPFATPAEKRSPFPRKSLPQAGESLQEKAFELFFNRFLGFGSIAATLAVVAVTEWLMRWMHGVMSPWFWTFFAVATGAIATWQFFRIKPQLANLRQGIRGERHVARFLEEFRANGYVP